jgi:glucokinase
LEYYIAVDIGATNTRIALGDQKGIIDKISFKTPREGDEYTIANEIYRIINERYKAELKIVKAIGIGTIGPLDIRSGRVVNTPNLPIHRFELRKPLMEKTGKPVYVLNDAVAAVWGEKVFGLGRDKNNILYVTISTGIGGGVIVNDHLLLGKMGNAHEIGHIVVEYDSRIPCGCGGYGHWEAYAGGGNIPRTSRILAKEYWNGGETEAYKLALDNKLEPPLLFKYFRSRDLFAKYVVDKMIKASIAGLASAINVYDPELVTIGGSIYLYNKDILEKPIIHGVMDHLVT